jgi:hypothetical protein
MKIKSNKKTLAKKSLEFMNLNDIDDDEPDLDNDINDKDTF